MAFESHYLYLDFFPLKRDTDLLEDFEQENDSSLTF